MPTSRIQPIHQLYGGCAPNFTPDLAKHPPGHDRPAGHGFGNIIPHPDHFPDPAC